MIKVATNVRIYPCQSAEVQYEDEGLHVWLYQYQHRDGTVSNVHEIWPSKAVIHSA